MVNCGDPDPPTVARIARTVAAALGHEWLEVLLPGEAPSEALSNPWAVPRPIVVDMATAEIDLAYRPVTTYERAAERACRWLVEATAGKDWREVLPGSARYMAESFDYAAEDAFLRASSRGAGPRMAGANPGARSPGARSPLKRSAFGEPAPGEMTTPFVVAFATSAVRTAAGEAARVPWRYCAATPAACGAAIDVPLIVLVGRRRSCTTPSVMPTPGANQSTQLP